MDKAQAIHDFWSSFGIPAYDSNTVKPDTEMPYITYDVSTGDIDAPVALTASIWYHSTSWEEISKKADTIAWVARSHMPVKIEGGYMWVTQGRPFSQRMNDPDDDMIRRIIINVNVEFFTNY